MFTINGKFTTATVYTDEVEPSALSQIQEMCNHPAFTKPIAIMPDVHAGKGSVIGFTMPFDGKIVPSVVGVDIGCGLSSYTIDINRELTHTDLSDIDEKIRSVVPLGKSHYGKPVIADMLSTLAMRYYSKLLYFANVYFSKLNLKPDFSYEHIEKLLDYAGTAAWFGAGSLGGGNHFIELSKYSGSETKHMITVHSGSRYFGLQICNIHDEILKQSGEYFLSGAAAFDYLNDMVIAQCYASLSREIMLKNIKTACAEYIVYNPDDELVSETIHNYISFDENEIIIRKGAISAAAGKSIQIPLNMADGTLICEGKGNSEWNYSAPHGAGRLYSRSAAKKSLSMDDFKERMEGVYISNMSESLLDESPMAYKNGDEIKALISDTATIVHHLKPVLNVKA